MEGRERTPMSLEEKVDALVVSVAKIEAALTYDGTGLLPAFKEHCASNDKFEEDFHKFRRLVLTIIGVLIGSGVLGVGAIEAIRALAGG